MSLSFLEAELTGVACRVEEIEERLRRQRDTVHTDRSQAERIDRLEADICSLRGDVLELTEIINSNAAGVQSRLSRIEAKLKELAK